MRIRFSILLCLIGINLASCQNPTKDTNNESVDSVLYLDVDQIPRFHYKNMTALEYIYQNLEWPKEFDGQGTIIVSFIIGKDGVVSNVKIVKSLSFECDNEVKRVLSSMPKWQNGLLNNKPVDVLLYLPILFKLNY